MKKWYTIQNKADAPEAEVCIYDEIGFFGVRAKDFITELKAVNKPIHLRINSPGGEVMDGLAIGNYLASYPHAVRATIDGMAASIASIIAASIKHVTIAANAFVMIHNPWSMEAGDSNEMRETADFLDKIKASLVTTYAKKCGKPRETISKWMDEATWFNAFEAMEAGLVDAISQSSEAKAAFALDRLGEIPERVSLAVTGGTTASATQPKEPPMTELLKVLAAAGIITAEATDKEASIAAKAWLDTNTKRIEALHAKVDDALKAEAEAAVAAKVPDEKQRPALVAAYLKDPDGAKAFLAAIPAHQAKKPSNEPIPIPRSEQQSDDESYKKLPHGPERQKAFLAKFPIKN